MEKSFLAHGPYKNRWKLRFSGRTVVCPPCSGTIVFYSSVQWEPPHVRSKRRLGRRCSVSLQYILFISDGWAWFPKTIICLKDWKTSSQMIMALKSLTVHLTEGKRRKDGADIWEFLKIFRHYHALNPKESCTAYFITFGFCFLLLLN